MTQTPPFWTWLLHPSKLHRFIWAPCVMQSPPLTTPLLHPSCLFKWGVVCGCILLDETIRLKCVSAALSSRTCREKIMVQCICLILLLNQLEIIILSNKLYDIEISIVNSSVLTQFSSNCYIVAEKNWTSYIICLYKHETSISNY